MGFGRASYSPVWVAWISFGFFFLRVSFICLAADGPLGGTTAPTAVSSPIALDPKLRPEVNPEYNDCGQACLYAKAKETVSLQLLYIAGKIEKLQKMIDPKSGATDQDFYHELTGVCYTNVNEAGKECVKRYLAIYIPILYKIQAQLAKLNDAEASLNNDVPVSGTQVGQPASPLAKFALGGAKAKKAQIPYVPTLKDLEEEQKRLQKTSSYSYELALEKLPRKPSPDDFVKLMSFDDPSQPGHKILKIVMKPDGKGPEIDQEKYNKALVDYETALKRANVNLEETLGNKDFRRNVADNYFKRYDGKSGPTELEGRRSRDAYNEQRLEIVKTGNNAIYGKLGGINVGTQNFSVDPGVQIKSPPAGQGQQRDIYVAASPEQAKKVIEIAQALLVSL